MQAITLVSLALVLSLGCGPTQPSTPTKSRQASALAPGAQAVATAFENLTVIPMDDERVLADHTVIVQGERVVAVGPTKSIEIPQDAHRIDGTGKYLVPGLTEMHGHIPEASDSPAYVESVLTLYVANGITCVRGMLGWPGQLELRSRASKGEILSPTLYLAGPKFNDASVESPQQAEKMVEAQKKEGWDLLKVHWGLKRDEYDAIVRTAKQLGIRFGGHVSGDVGLAHAIAMGQSSIDHMDGYIEYLEGDKASVSDKDLTSVALMTKDAGTWIVPTMAFWDTYLGVGTLEERLVYDELQYMPKSLVQDWEDTVRAILADSEFDAKQGALISENRRRLLGALHRHGAKVVFGTDSPQWFSVPGFSLHRETEIMVAAGMSPRAVLHSATRLPGEYFSNVDAFGSIAAGQRADLVLLDKNPLEGVANLRSIAGVMLRGRWLDKAEIDRRLAAISAMHQHATE